MNKLLNKIFHLNALNAGAYLLALGLLGSSGPAFAEKALNWKDLLQAAKEKSHQIKSRSFLAEGSAEDNSRAWGGVLPKLDVEAKKSKTDKTVGQTDLTPETTSKNDVEEMQARITLPLFRGFATLADIRKTQAEYLKSLEDKKLSEVELRHELRRVLADYLVSIERQDVYSRLTTRQKMNVDLLKLKYNSGSEARWGHKQALAELQSYEWKIAEQKKSEATALLQIALLTGIEPRNLQLKISLAELEKVETNPEIPRHPELRLRELSVQSAAEDVIAARSELFPKIDAFYGYQQFKFETGPETGEKIYGVGLTWNLFDGFSNMHQVSQAKAVKMAKEADLEFEKRKLEIDLKESQDQLTLLQNKLPILESALEAAKERSKTVNEQYKAGLRSYLDWEQSQSKLIRSEEDLLEGKKSLLLSIAAFEKQQGLGL